jgi:hypothetical protein
LYAFRLNAGHKESFSGGSVVCSALGHTFDIGKALKEHDGVIYTTNEFLGEALARYDALERVPKDEVPEDLKPVEVPGEGTVMTPELLAKQAPIPRGEGEIPAEHKDEPSTEAEAVQAGEEVSGKASPAPAGPPRRR